MKYILFILVPLKNCLNNSTTVSGQNISVCLHFELQLIVQKAMSGSVFGEVKFMLKSPLKLIGRKRQSIDILFLISNPAILPVNWSFKFENFPCSKMYFFKGLSNKSFKYFLNILLII